MNEGWYRRGTVDRSKDGGRVELKNRGRALACNSGKRNIQRAVK